MTTDENPAADPRLEHIIELLTRLASGELDARLPLPTGGDQLDIVSGALNMFAEELQAAFVEQRRLNESLEERVRQRTAELQAQLATIEQQRGMIEQLSLPVLKVWSDVLVVPVVGPVDAERSRRLTEALLAAIAAEQAAVAILDVTGMPIVDTQAASHFIAMAQAANMLGARALITGVSPHNAQTLTRLGVDLTAMEFAGTLEQGLGRVLAR